MTDEQRTARSNAEEDGGNTHAGAERSPSSSRPNVQRATAAPAGRAVETDVSINPSLQRAGTLPVRRGGSGGEDVVETGRRRGRTISARDPQIDVRPLSPRSQILGRKASTRTDNNRDGSLGAIRDGRSSEPGRARASTQSSHPSFSSPGMRRRMSTWATNGQSPRPRAFTITRRPTVLLAQPQAQGAATGRDMDAQSAVFTLAGPQQFDALAGNQPYVDPGYADLNPAYDQPVNSRPVWGLAKPLPRVIRPGMVPTRSELKVQIPNQAQLQDPANVDLEQGRVEPTLRLGKISSQLQSAREERENRWFNSHEKGPSAISPIGGAPSTIARPLSPQSQAISESEDDLRPAFSRQGEHLPAVQELPTRPPTPEEADEAQHQDWYPDDGASIATEKLGEGGLDGDWIGEEIPLKAYDPETDEIHNLHTHWSVIRLRFREPLAELLAVTVQLTLGFCADLAVTTSGNKSGNEATTDWAWGLATMVGIYIAGGISGAHLNPAISIMLYIYRGFPLRKVPVYVFAQVLGAFLAGLIAFGLYQKNIIEYGGTDIANGGTIVDFITYPRYDWIDAGTAFFTEFTGTAILAIAVLALGDDTNAPPGAGMNAFVLGLIITVLSMAFGYNTGAAMNPARDLGPRLACLALGYGSKIFRDGYWFYGPWAATITGAIFGAFLYDAAIFVGGESPVNYPRRRIQRSGHKWKRKWGQRLRRGRRRLTVGLKGEMENGVVNGEKL